MVAEGVADPQGVVVVRRVRQRDTGARGVAGAEEGPEVGLAGDPQRGDEQVIPAAVAVDGADSAGGTWRRSTRRGGKPFVVHR